MRKILLSIISLFSLATVVLAQQMTSGYGNINEALKAHSSAKFTLSPAEQRAYGVMSDVGLQSRVTLNSNPVFMQITNVKPDSAAQQLSAVGYIGIAGADTEGDFLPYEGNGSTDYRVGAFGEYATKHSGTLAGHIQYARGKHRNIGWSAMRLPELYLPYISTDSCGGDFKFDSYYAEGSYAFDLNGWTLGAKASFYGEQSYRLTDPRALNNTTWLRFNAGVGKYIGRHLLMFDAGYGRNKQHMQLRYWRPGQQDRFFVCYGFGLYDTRQSAVSFGKSRMYYVDELNMRMQYLSPQDKPVSLYASFGYTHDHMETEESDIYNLYESNTNVLSPQLMLTYSPCRSWTFRFAASVELQRRNGYENIIEEYLADVDYNSYDFRVIDSQQNYKRDVTDVLLAVSAAHRMGSVEVTLQGGLATNRYDEKYNGGIYSIQVSTCTPHVKAILGWHGKRDAIDFCMLYAHQGVGTHLYDVTMQNTKIKHLDFQHAFAPYAYRAADCNQFAMELTWRHKIGKMWVGLGGDLCVTNGNRVSDAVYSGNIGFDSTAPMLSAEAGKHKERYGSLKAFVAF